MNGNSFLGFPQHPVWLRGIGFGQKKDNSACNNYKSDEKLKKIVTTINVWAYTLKPFETMRQTDRHTDRRTGGQTDRQTDRRTD